MDKLYTEKNLPLVSPYVSAESADIVIEEIKKSPARHFIHPSKPLYFPLQNKFNRVLKRSVDIIISLLIITGILSWLIPILAILIKLDSRGPVFFVQKRNKHAGRFFTCIKLRTMVVNKDADLVAASENDERITRFGNFLRNHYLDELPQFINVLSGDMSIVGPRPHMLSDNTKYEKLIPYYSSRQLVKPGITGLAQVKGYCGPANDFQKIKARTDMDIFYVKNWSPALDRAILYRTISKTLGI